jgi:hypothetical protein
MAGLKEICGQVGNLSMLPVEMDPVVAGLDPLEPVRPTDMR